MNNTQVGTATVRITGIGNYTGILLEDFTIKAKSDSSIPKNNEATSGSAAKGKDTVKKVPAKIDNNGNISAIVAEDIIVDAIAAAKEKSSEKIEVKIRIDIPAESESLVATFSAASVRKLIEEDVSAEIKNIIGDRPLYSISLKAVQNGETVQIADLGEGFARIVLPYTPQEGEDPSKLYVAYIDDSGNIHYMAGSYYDADLGGVVFETNHFSLFAVAYDAETSHDLEQIGTKTGGSLPSEWITVIWCILAIAVISFGRVFLKRKYLNEIK